MAWRENIINILNNVHNFFFLDSSTRKKLVQFIKVFVNFINILSDVNRNKFVVYRIKKSLLNVE